MTLTEKARKFPQCSLSLPVRFGFSRAAKQGGFKRGVFPIWTCPSFFVLFCPFWYFPDFFRDFLDLCGDSPGIFPIGPFPLSRPINSTATQSGPFPKKVGNPAVWKPPGLASLNGLLTRDFSHWGTLKGVLPRGGFLAMKEVRR